MNDRHRAELESAGSDEPALEPAPNPRVPHRLLVTSFALSTVGGLLLPLWMGFAVSVAFFAPAAGLVLRLAKDNPTPQIRNLARIALAAALLGLAAYVVFLGLYLYDAPSVGLGSLTTSGSLLLGVLLVWAIVWRLRNSGD
jgi:hypothetical protein